MEIRTNRTHTITLTDQEAFVIRCLAGTIAPSQVEDLVTESIVYDYPKYEHLRGTSNDVQQVIRDLYDVLAESFPA